MANIKDIKRRIISVNKTEHITKAMEMVAASRIFNAEIRIRTFYNYAARMIALIQHLREVAPFIEHPLLEIRERIEKSAVVILTSNRGLCGAYNENVIKEAENLIRRLSSIREGVKIIVSGRVGHNYLKFRGMQISHYYQNVSDKPSFEEAQNMGAHLTDLYINRQVDEIYLVFNHFLNAMSQQPVKLRLLPVSKAIPGKVEEEIDVTPEFSIDEMLETLLAKYIREKIAEESKGEFLFEPSGYVFEPSEKELFMVLLPQYIETAIFYALLDASASEHGARRTAMKMATDNAERVIENLTRTYHRLRQQKITTEIVEIVQGAEAIKTAHGILKG